MKKLLIVGATYSNNFGDMLFAKMIVDAIWPHHLVKFYKLSDYARKFIGEDRIADFNNKDADALIYMPGGFFGDRHDTSLYVTWLWFERYFPIGIKFAKKNKPMLVLGVGAGPCKYSIMKKIIYYVCSKAEKVIVREDDSKDFLATLEIDCDVTSDLAQLITKYETPTVQLNNIDKKRLLIHVNQNNQVASVLIPAVKKFYESHKDEYSIVVASDQICENDKAVYEKIREFAGSDVEFYKYGDPLELCNIIQQCDVVITYKLHMGIVACAYGKSVIAFPVHYKKVERYYKQIKCSDRVLPFYLTNSDSAYDLIEKYHDKCVKIPNEIIMASEKNYQELNAFLRRL